MKKQSLNPAEKAVKDIRDMLNRYSGTKRERLLSSWLSEYAKYIKQEETFKPQFLKRYKRGEIILVNLGYRIGSEEGGPHYAIVLDKHNSPYSDTITILPLSSKKATTKSSKYTLDLGNEVYNKLHEKYLKKFNECIKDVSIVPIENSNKFKISVGIDTTDSDKVEKEINVLKEGSIALVSQITTVSKMRIIKPLRTTDGLSGVCVSNSILDIIDNKIKELYIGN